MIHHHLEEKDKSLQAVSFQDLPRVKVRKKVIILLSLEKFWREKKRRRGREAWRQSVHTDWWHNWGIWRTSILLIGSSVEKPGSRSEQLPVGMQQCCNDTGSLYWFDWFHGEPTEPLIKNETNNNESMTVFYQCIDLMKLINDCWVISHLLVYGGPTLP